MQVRTASDPPLKPANAIFRNFEKFTRGSANWFGNIATVILLIMLVITVLDVFGSKLFNKPVYGSQEMISLLQGAMIAMVVAMAQLAGQHINVDLFTARLPIRAQAVISSLISLILLAVFAILTWQTFMLGISIRDSHQYTITLHLPYHYTLFTMGVAFIVVCLVFLLEFINSLKGAFRP